MSKYDGGPAYPRPASEAHQHGMHSPQEGMSLRDAIALSARHEDLPIPEKIDDCMSILGVIHWRPREHWMQLVAKLRYEYADIVLKERAK